MKNLWLWNLWDSFKKADKAQHSHSLIRAYSEPEETCPACIQKQMLIKAIDDCGLAEEFQPPKSLEEFEKRLLNDPVAYSYFKYGRAVERDSMLNPDQREKRKLEAAYSLIQAGINPIDV